ncbi:hypothetical protein PL321_06895 [Caloramator sp. mosi_1]|uniref:hypothetical protein n=1 Tax=Caloramator sp. mosi_1 TaxID=3023090 RepID=UPI0023621423|nr:hypothetical protein [Caloramator sp. mosi_1]WDC85188.1 hypothetical protein PL321_06895 [Caloramator sp. mosi_1]
MIDYKAPTTFIGTGFRRILLMEEFGSNIFLEKNYNAVDIYYKDFSFPFKRRFGIYDNNYVDYYNVKNAEIISYFTDGKNQIPYIFKYNNRWVATKYDSEG